MGNSNKVRFILTVNVTDTCSISTLWNKTFLFNHFGNKTKRCVEMCHSKGNVLGCAWDTRLIKKLRRQNLRLYVNKASEHIDSNILYFILLVDLNP